MQDPEGFIEDGGWSFLDAEQSDSDEEDGDEESDFAPRSDSVYGGNCARQACPPFSINKARHVAQS